MKIDRFSQLNEEASIEEYYEIWYYDKHGDEQEYYGDEYMDINPYDIEDIINFFTQLEKIGERVYIKKIVAKRLSDRMLNKLKLEFEAKKYNI
jgi:hypothetical protein